VVGACIGGVCGLNDLHAPSVETHTGTTDRAGPNWYAGQHRLGSLKRRCGLRVAVRRSRVVAEACASVGLPVHFSTLPSCHVVSRRSMRLG
jgi:hypothetical protein